MGNWGEITPLQLGVISPQCYNSARRPHLCRKLLETSNLQGYFGFVVFSSTKHQPYRPTFKNSRTGRKATTGILPINRPMPIRLAVALNMTSRITFETWKGNLSTAAPGRNNLVVTVALCLGEKFTKKNILPDAQCHVWYLYYDMNGLNLW